MMRLEIADTPLVEVKAGTFTFCRSDGKQAKAELYIRCEPRPERSNPDFLRIMDRRHDALNTQYNDACDTLEAAGCTFVHYDEVKPDPFF